MSTKYLNINFPQFQPTTVQNMNLIHNKMFKNIKFLHVGADP